MNIDKNILLNIKTDCFESLKLQGKNPKDKRSTESRRDLDKVTKKGTHIGKSNCGNEIAETPSLYQRNISLSTDIDITLQQPAKIGIYEIAVDVGNQDHGKNSSVLKQKSATPDNQFADKSNCYSRLSVDSEQPEVDTAYLANFGINFENELVDVPFGCSLDLNSYLSGEPEEVTSSDNKYGCIDEQADFHLLDDGFDEGDLFNHLETKKLSEPVQVERTDWFKGDVSLEAAVRLKDQNVRDKMKVKRGAWSRNQVPYDRLNNNIEIERRVDDCEVPKNLQWLLDFQRKQMVEGPNRMNFEHFGGELDRLDWADKEWIQFCENARSTGGFPLDSSVGALEETYIAKNYKESYSIEFAPAIHDNIAKDLAKSYIIGPYKLDLLPFDFTWSHPIFGVFKKRFGIETEKVRTVHDSSSREARPESLNDTMELATPIKLQDNRHATRGESLLRMINEHFDFDIDNLADVQKLHDYLVEQFQSPQDYNEGFVTMSKEDLEAAFNQMFIRAVDVHKMAFLWFDVTKPLPDYILKGRGLVDPSDLRVYYNLRFVFGSIASVSHFFRFSMGLRFLHLNDKTRTPSGELLLPIVDTRKYTGSTYFDDSLLQVYGRTLEEAVATHELVSQRFLNLVHDDCLGVTLNIEKRFPDAVISTVKEYLGVERNSVNRTKRLSDLRVDSGIISLTAFVSRGLTCKQELSSVNGTMLFYSAVTACPAVFTKRIRATERKYDDKARKYKFGIPRGVVIDVNTFIKYWPRWNRESYVPSNKWNSMISLGIRTDASFEGYGGVNIARKEYFYGVWDCWAAHELDISPLELVIVILAVTLWADDFRCRSVVTECDNDSCVELINSLRPHSPSMTVGCRSLAILCNTISTILGSVHRSSVTNKLADIGSRGFDEASFWEEAERYYPRDEWKQVFIDEEVLNHLLIRMRRANGKNTRFEKNEGY
jgi:hypothetical protein